MLYLLFIFLSWCKYSVFFRKKVSHSYKKVSTFYKKVVQVRTKSPKAPGAKHTRGYKLLTINFTQFPVSVSKVVDELSSSFGPYEIGMGVGSAHLLLSTITLRVEEGAVAGAALCQAHVGVIGIEEKLTALVNIDHQLGGLVGVPSLRRRPKSLTSRFTTSNFLFI